MHYFEYQNGELFAEQVPVRRIAKEVGTPAYIYSLATLKRHYQVFDRAFARVPHVICFSVKANSAPLFGEGSEHRQVGIGLD